MKKVLLIVLIFLLVIVALLIKIYIFNPLENVPTLERINNSISKGIDFLYENQLDYGEFKTYICDDKDLEECLFDSSPFVTTFVLYFFNNMEGEKVEIMTEKALDFLLNEQEEGGIWRYWSSRNDKKISPDLDDISTISFILKTNGIDIDDNYQLIKENVNDDNLFFTWLYSGKERNDVDCVVNANVLLYLGENNPSVCSYINEAIKSDESCSVYYLGKLSFFYMVSRAFENNITCFDKSKDEIINYILNHQNKDGSFGNELETAFGLTTLLNFNYSGNEIESSLINLLENQQKDGSWKRKAAFCRGIDLTESGPYFGSEELTTALALEALKKYSETVLEK